MTFGCISSSLACRCWAPCSRSRTRSSQDGRLEPTREVDRAVHRSPIRQEDLACERGNPEPTYQPPSSTIYLCYVRSEVPDVNAGARCAQTSAERQQVSPLHFCKEDLCVAIRFTASCRHRSWNDCSNTRMPRFVPQLLTRCSKPPSCEASDLCSARRLPRSRQPGCIGRSTTPAAFSRHRDRSSETKGRSPRRIRPSTTSTSDRRDL